MNAVLSETGQVTIPKSIRDDLGLVAGTVLDFTEESGRIVAKKISSVDPITAWRGRGRIPTGYSVDNYLSSTREAR